MSDKPFGYCDAIPDEYRDLFMWISQDVAMLHHKWSTYLGLYGSKERTDLISEAAPAAFHVIEESLRNDIIMTACRLGDPAITFGKSNASFAALIEKAGTSAIIGAMSAEFDEAVEPLRVVRNKRLGHTDLNTRILPHQNLLPAITQERIERIAELAARMLNAVLVRHADQELYFHMVAHGDVEALVFWLKQGLEYRADKRRRRSSTPDTPESS